MFLNELSPLKSRIKKNDKKFNILITQKAISRDRLNLVFNRVKAE